MNRSNLDRRELHRELTFLFGSVGIRSGVFDWLVAPFLFPERLRWARAYVAVVGLVLLVTSVLEARLGR